MEKPFRARPKAICICGPTATGKTAAAVAVCASLGGEVLSMDAMQVYRGLDIGTAKATAREMQGIPHHLLSFVQPDAAYSVRDYQRDARAALHDVLARGRLPVFAGGTGLYLQAVSRPLQFTRGAVDAALRAQLAAEAETEAGRAALHARLAAVDPNAAARLHRNNVRRVIRALEVHQATGVPMSEQAGEWEGESDQDWLILALTWPRDTLYARINARVDRMIDAGLVQEVRGLLEMGVPPGAQSMQAIGYKEMIRHLHGECTMPEAADAIRQGTRRYAKRQLTWLRRDARVRWVDLSMYADDSTARAAIVEMARAFAIGD